MASISRFFWNNGLRKRISDRGGLFPKNIKPETILHQLQNALQLNGSADTYANFIWFEGYIVMVILALIGSAAIGNDFHHGSLPFYLSKPIGPFHYIFGKCLAVGIFINLITTIPAVLLFIEYGFIDTWSYYWDNLRLFLGIIFYGSLITITLSLLLIATASWVKRTMPMVMIWTVMMVLGRMIQRWLVDGLHLRKEWRLIDIWNDLYLAGHWALGTPHEALRPPWQMQPSYHAALLVIGICIVTCIFYLRKKIQAVEIVA